MVKRKRYVKEEVIIVTDFAKVMKSVISIQQNRCFTISHAISKFEVRFKDVSVPRQQSECFHVDATFYQAFFNL